MKISDIINALTVNKSLENRLEALEGRLFTLPEALKLDADSAYLIIVPETISPEDYAQLEGALARFPNVVLIAANGVKTIQIM